MPLLSYALTSVANVKAYLDITTSTKDTLIELLINGCTDWIEAECGNRRFKDSTTDITEYYDGDYDSTGRDKIFLKQFPINSITSVSYKSGGNISPTWVDYSLNDYERNDEQGVLYFANETRQYLLALPRGRQIVKVVYKAGYITIPSDLELCCIKLVAKELNKRKSQGLTQEGVGGATFQWNEDIAPDIKKIIANYTRWLK